MRVNIREAMQVPTLVRHMLKNNVPAPSCIPPAGLEVLTRRHVNDALSELHLRSGLQVLKGTRTRQEVFKKLMTPCKRPHADTPNPPIRFRRRYSTNCSSNFSGINPSRPARPRNSRMAFLPIGP